jgi:hypothetical protein
MSLSSRFLELVTDSSDGKLSWSKCGAIIAGTAFTYKMVADRPDDWLLWTIYMLTVGGYVVLLKLLNLRYGGGNARTTP